MIIVVIIANFIFVVFDAIRDAWVERIVDWWEWHIVKWTSFFGMQILIIGLAIQAKLIPITAISLLIGGLYAAVCSIAWNFVYQWLRDK